MRISKNQNVKAETELCEVTVAQEPTAAECELPTAIDSAISHIQSAIEALATYNDDIELAKSAIADLSVILFTLK